VRRVLTSGVCILVSELSRFSLSPGQLGEPFAPEQALALTPLRPRDQRRMQTLPSPLFQPPVFGLSQSPVFELHQALVFALFQSLDFASTPALVLDLFQSPVLPLIQSPDLALILALDLTPFLLLFQGLFLAPDQPPFPPAISHFDLLSAPCLLSAVYSPLSTFAFALARPRTRRRRTRRQSLLFHIFMSFNIRIRAGPSV